MRSIRLSLVLYFLLLLGAGLGIVSILVYQNTRSALIEKQHAEELLRKAQHEEKVRQVDARLNQDLIVQANTLASLAQLQWKSSRVRFQSMVELEQLVAGIVPTALLSFDKFMALSVAHQKPLEDGWHTFSLAEILFDENEILHNRDSSAAEYFQITAVGGNKEPIQYRSPSLGQRRFSVDSSLKPFEPTFTDLELQPGLRVRVVSLKVPVGFSSVRYPAFTPPTGRPLGFDRERHPFPPPRYEGNGRSRSVERPPQPERPALDFYIHCASDIAEERDQEIAMLASKLAEGVQESEEKSQESLASLRNNLLLVSLGVFAASTAGGLFLVALGLAPLRRLSFAVSKVSARDFKLPFDDKPLPRELRPIVERLTSALDQLKRAFTREKQAAADISHELRTPLAALLTTTELALRKPRTANEYRELFQDCRETLQQMTQMVERLLALARLDAGTDLVRARETDVGALAIQCATLVRPLAEAHDLTLTVEQEGALATTTDPDKLREVLNNLLHNAIQYNRPHGSVALNVCRENGHVKIEVRDTGIGIAPEAQEHIFERFFRADPSRTGDSANTGLGLAIVKGYVELMGGTIEVDSTPGEGSTFRLELPVSLKRSA